jgi:hypothetical protein
LRQHYEDYFKEINNVAESEDYYLVVKFNRGLKEGTALKVLVRRNEPGVRNMHRQLHDVLGRV